MFSQALSQDILWAVHVPAFQGMECLVRKNTNWAGLEGPVHAMAMSYLGCTIMEHGKLIKLSSMWHKLSLIKASFRIKPDYTPSMASVKQAGKESCGVFVLIWAQTGPTLDSKSQLQLKFKNFSINGVLFPKWNSCQALSPANIYMKESLSGTVVTFFNRSSPCHKTMFPYALTKMIFFTFTC